MIRVIHGDNNVASRKQLEFLVESARKKGQEVIKVDGTIILDDLSVQVRSSGLFSESKLVVVEDFFSDKRAINDGFKSILGRLEGDVVFWEGREIAGKKLTDLKKISKDISIFKVQREVFKFLDNLSPGNSKATIKLLRAVLAKGDSPEFLLFMIARQVRLLLWAKLDPQGMVLAPWQKAKILNQASTWSVKGLRDFHLNLIQLDRGNKESRLAVDLAGSLELLLLSV